MFVFRDHFKTSKAYDTRISFIIVIGASISVNLILKVKSEHISHQKENKVHFNT